MSITRNLSYSPFGGSFSYILFKFYSVGRTMTHLVSATYQYQLASLQSMTELGEISRV